MRALDLIGGVAQRKGRRTSEPEDSVRLRLVVLATVMVASVAVIAQGASDPFTAVSALLLIPAGFAFSHVRRRRRNTGAKIFLAIGMLAALGGFVQRMQGATSVDDARVALASLFLWVQVLHSFDLPRRRDLAFSIVASLLLMAEAASLSLGSDLILFVIPYAALAGAWLSLSHRSQAAESAAPAAIRRERPPAGRATRARGARSIAATLASVGTASFVVFLAVPRLPGSLVVAPPASLVQRVAVPGFNGAVVNPGLLSRSGRSGADFSPVAYPGYGHSVDLRVRGRLSDQVVLKVRSPQAAFWRAQAYDRFDGTTWTASDTLTQPLPGGGPLPFAVPEAAEPSPAVPTRQVIQTFYVLHEQPNVVFGAYQERQVYFPAPNLVADRYGSVRAPILLEPGTIYSVVSSVPVTNPALLRSAQTTWPSGLLRQYTQLPADMPERVRALAELITEGSATTYDKVIAVQNWLRAHTRYNIDVAPDPPGVDAVDYFLFVRRQGFCEHIASAMAVLLRAVGIPTRFAVGFDAGERNLFTGYYEVRESDAHSWVEVNYPGLGWLEYDPTHGVPDGAPGLGRRFLAPQVFAAIGRFLGRILPGPVKRAAVRAARFVGRVVVTSWPAAAGTAAVTAMAVAAWTARRRKRRAARAPPATGAAAAWAMMSRTLERRGMARAKQQTPSEHLEAVLKDGTLPPSVRTDIRTVVRTFERDRFSAAKPPTSEVQMALSAAARVRHTLRGHRSLRSAPLT
jgi:transglutaminase-like putative cysteine protease